MTLGFVREALRLLESPRAKVAFEYLAASEGTTPTALTDALTRWVRATDWRTITKQPHPMHLTGVDQWVVFATREHEPEVIVLIGLLRGNV
jgi:hypothetical protein